MEKRVMRDVFIEELCRRMKDDDSIVFLTADLGAPALDKMRVDFPERCINVGIAEANLINVGAGLALEGKKVFCYGIAAFITMRAYEQIRINVAMASQVRPMNINIIGVGCGFSYVTSGPSHHALEDISIMRTLPNMELFSPSDCSVTKEFVEYSLLVNTPKYIRLDGEPCENICMGRTAFSIGDGFRAIASGIDAYIVATGAMVHTALEASRKLWGHGHSVGVIDAFMLKRLNLGLAKVLRGYPIVFTLEEGFTGVGGLDSAVSTLIIEDEIANWRRFPPRVVPLGVPDKYFFEVGNREFLHKLCGINVDGVVETVLSFL